MTIQHTFENHKADILDRSSPWAGAVAQEAFYRLVVESTNGFDSLSDAVIRDQKFHDGLGLLAQRNSVQHTLSQLNIRANNGALSSNVREASRLAAHELSQELIRFDSALWPAFRTSTSSAVSAALEPVFSLAKSSAGGLAGVGMQNLIWDARFDQWETEGRSSTYVAGEMVKDYLGFGAQSIAGLTAAFGSFVRVGASSLQASPVLRTLGLAYLSNVPAGSAAFKAVVARAGVAGMALAAAWEGGARFGRWLNNQWGLEIGDGIDAVVDFIADVVGSNPTNDAAEQDSRRVLSLLLERIAPGADLGDMKRLLSLQSTQGGFAEMVGLHNALRGLLAPELSISPEGPDDHAGLWSEILQTLKATKDRYPSDGGQLRFVTDLEESANETAAAAQQDIAVRYALVHGNSFVIEGYPSLYVQHNLNGELDLYDPDTGKGALTEAYLRDRAVSLSYQMKANTGAFGDVDHEGDIARVEVEGPGIAIHDAENGEKLTIEGAHEVQFGLYFGDATRKDVHQGGDTHDGADELAGNGGHDVIDGGERHLRRSG